MPDTRQHRGPHPEDAQLFSADRWPVLQQATQDLSWLLSRNYAAPSATKLVGDRYQLNVRQRIAVGRSACSDESLERRRAREVRCDGGEIDELWIDGYNVLISVEAGQAGGVILGGRDGCYRDMASMHGTYRKVAETLPSIRLLGDLLNRLKINTCRWLLDQPVSNSGKLKTMLRETAEEHGWNWQIELVSDPDPVLIRCGRVVASSDSQILDGASAWTNLARYTIATRIADAWVVPMWAAEA